MKRASLTWVVRSSYLAAAASRAVLACSPSFWGMPVSYAFSCTTLLCKIVHQNAVLTIAKSMHGPLEPMIHSAGALHGYFSALCIVPVCLKTRVSRHAEGWCTAAEVVRRGGIPLQGWCGGVVYRCRGGAEGWYTAAAVVQKQH